MRDLVVGRDASSLLSDAVTGGGSNDEHGGVRDGHETAEPGLRSHQVVETGIEAEVGDVETDGQEAPLPIIEEFVFHP